MPHARNTDWKAEPGRNAALQDFRELRFQISPDLADEISRLRREALQTFFQRQHLFMGAVSIGSTGIRGARQFQKCQRAENGFAVLTFFRCAAGCFRFGQELFGLLGIASALGRCDGRHLMALPGDGKHAVAVRGKCHGQKDVLPGAERHVVQHEEVRRFLPRQVTDALPAVARQLHGRKRHEPQAASGVIPALGL